MSQLEETLARLHRHPGVEHLLILGRDGLLVRHLGNGGPLDAETVAAMVPGVASACTALGRAGEQGEFTTTVVEFSRGVAIVLPLSSELLLAVLLQPGVGFAALLHEVRQERAQLAALV